MKCLPTLVFAAVMLSGCGHSELKAPCGPTASLAENPCIVIPFNMAEAPVQEESY